MKIIGKRKHKYNAKRKSIDGIVFDSLKEAKRFTELKMLEKAGSIKNLELQPRFLLQESFKKEGKTIRAIYYVADFSYFQNGNRCVEDVKGFKTDVYNLKKKLFLKKYPDVVFREI